jgi:hypothetical protein
MSHPSKKKASVRSKVSSSEEEGGQDYDDILGFPGNGFKDKDDANPLHPLRSGNRMWMVMTNK